MNVGELCVRRAVVTHKEDTVLSAARLMRDEHVGCLVVVSEDGNGAVPIGMITDRDLTLRVLAQRADPESTTVDKVMSKDVLSTVETAGIYETLELLRQRGVRRVAVTDNDKRLVGVLTVDDILDFVNDEIGAVIRLFRTEQMKERES